MRKIFQALRLRFDPEPDVCPTAAFEPEELTWPRVVRRAFSDPRVPHESTGVEGRGTEEVKTNDVSGRVKAGEVGFTIEFGRPGVGVWFREIQEMCWALAKAGVDFEKKNPITSLMKDVATGTLREDILERKDDVGDRRDQSARSRGPKKSSASCGKSRSGSTPSSRSAWARAATRTATIARSRRSSRGWATTWSAPRRTSGSAGIPTPLLPVAEGRSGRAGEPMTNTLHRFGDAESFRDDFIVFCVPSRGQNDENASRSCGGSSRWR